MLNRARVAFNPITSLKLFDPSGRRKKEKVEVTSNPASKILDFVNSQNDKLELGYRSLVLTVIKGDANGVKLILQEPKSKIHSEIIPLSTSKSSYNNTDTPIETTLAEKIDEIVNEFYNRFTQSMHLQEAA